jgi:hypothetical protein
MMSLKRVDNFCLEEKDLTLALSRRREQHTQPDKVRFLVNISVFTLRLFYRLASSPFGEE